MPSVADALAQFPVVSTLPLQWGEHDAFDHVNNVVYFRWFETGRIAYAERMGLWQVRHTQGLMAILASITCNYRKQLRWPDTIHIGTRVTKLGRSSMTIVHAIYSEHLQQIATEAESTVVMFDTRAQRPVKISEEFRRAVIALEGWPPEG